MKGCLLSRKVVVLRALLSLKELALRFVRLSDEAAALKWEALEGEAEHKCMGSGARARLAVLPAVMCWCVLSMAAALPACETRLPSPAPSPPPPIFPPPKQGAAQRARRASCG